MAQTNAPEPEDAEAPVRLSPILGIHPNVYVPATYGVIFALVLFVLLVLPGLRRPGGDLVVEGTPSGAAVFVDDRYAGAVPVRVFVERGAHRVSVSKSGHSPHVLEIEMGNRLLGSRFFPKTVSLTVALEPVDPRAILEPALREYAGWALGGETAAQYQAPTPLSDAVVDLLSARRDPSAREAAWAATRAAAGHAVTESAFRDFSRAAMVAASSGGALSPSALVELVHRAAGVAGLAALAPRVVPEWNLSAPAEAAASAGGGAYRDASASVVAGEGSPSRVGRTPIRLAGEWFVPVPSGVVAIGADSTEVDDARYAPSDDWVVEHDVFVDSFYLLTREVTEALFFRFVDAVPEWLPAADQPDRYLSDLDPDDSRAVRFVPAAAAEAFAEWFSSLDEVQSAGLLARLPSEYEWEAAARRFASAESADFGREPSARPLPGDAGEQVAAMLGGLWEWTSDAYVPARYIVAAEGAYADVAPERAVRGGSFVNPPRTVAITSRGSIPPETASPYVGFRLVLVPKE